MQRFLGKYLPGLTVKDGKYVRAEKSIGSVTGFYGNFLVSLRALVYLTYIGGDGVLNLLTTLF